MSTKFKPYPIELPTPDLSRWRAGNCGVDYVYQYSSGKPGKNAMIVGLTHGNEISGGLVVNQLLEDEFRPRSGTLTLVLNNIAAYERFSPQDADATRYIDEDMNRVWDEASLDGPRQTIELQRARELRPIVDGADYLLDLHSMHEADPPIMMGGYCKKGELLARQIGVPEYIIMDKGHAAGKRLRDYGGFGDRRSEKVAVLLESGQHFEKNAFPLALDVAARFLVAAGVAEKADVARYLMDYQPTPQKIVDITDAITIRSDNFRFADNFIGMQVIEKKGTVIGYDGDEEVVTPYDQCVLIQPTLRHAHCGTTAVRLGRLVEDYQD